MAKNNKTQTKKSRPVQPEPEDIVTEETTPVVPEPVVVRRGKTGAGTGTPNGPTVVKSLQPKKPGMPKWTWIAIGVAVVVLVSAAGAAFFRAGKSTETNTNGVVTDESDPNQPIPRKLDGVLVKPSRANTNIYAVMIENASDSRPQSGLDRASVVYEALAEGGIARFMALWPVGDEVEEIGPVRSARQYYIDWAEEYKPLYVHVGGSPQAMDYLKYEKPNVFNFDQFYRPRNFERVNFKRAPHNLYTNTKSLYIGLVAQVDDYVPTYESWKFKEEKRIDERPEITKDLTIDFSSFNYKVVFKYDRGQNQYQRWQGEKEHVMRDGAKIFAKNIVVQFTKTGAPSRDKLRIDMTTVGEGRALVVQDGGVIEATWKKTGVRERTRWYDATTGAELALNPGQTWIEIVPEGRPVTF